MKERIRLSPPHMGQTEQLYIKEAFDKNWIAPVGPNIPNFEDSICNFTQIKYAVALNSGASAIHLALILLGVSPGDEVLCSSFTFIASSNPILYLKAKPVFIDSESTSWNMDPHLLEEAIKDRIKRGIKPKAIIVVHTYGNAALMDEIMLISSQYEIPLIEDAAEAFGSTYKGKVVGGFGRIGVYSFNGNKIITTSAGGALVTNDKDISAQALYLSNQAKDYGIAFIHSELGFNYRMSNVLAGIGIGQMKVVYERIKQRRHVFEYYKKSLHDLPISFAPETPESTSNRWLTCITLDDDVSFSSEAIVGALEKENIESRLLWTPLHRQKIYRETQFYGNGYCEKLHEKGIALPSGSSMKVSDLDRVIDAIRKRF